MNFQVGQKVACVADNWPDGVVAMFLCPVRGRIYTVRGKSYCPWNLETPIGLYLEELVNPVLLMQDGEAEPAWAAVCFRPLVEKKTDISVFQRILDPAPRVSEDA